MNAAELELDVRRELDDLIAEVEYELDRDLDADERASVVEEFLAELDDEADDEAPPAASASPAAMAETLKRKQIAARFFDCGGPGSGVPGPCPEGDKGDKGGKGGKEGDKGKDEPPPPNSRGGKDNTPNPSLPKESRPELSKSEASAANNYAATSYETINAALRNGTTPPADRHAGESSPDKVHEQLQAAFAKTAPFEKPVEANRGLNLNPADAEKFIASLQTAKDANGTVRLPGYTSTVVGATGTPFSGNVKMSIQAVQGLDLKPYSASPKEHELLLNHNSTFRVTSIDKDKDGTAHVKLEQVRPDKQKEKEEKSEKAGKKTVWQKLKSAFGGG